MLTDEERALLRSMESGAELPIVQRDGRWAWEFGSLHAPRPVDTEAEARVLFVQHMALLLEAARVEREQSYQTEPRDA